MKDRNLGVGLLLYAAALSAQQALPGTYEGRFFFYSPEAGREVPIPAGLVITQAAEGKVTGKFQVFKYLCQGDYSAEGTYEGNKMTLKVGKGTTVDCGGGTLVLALEGNKLVGKLGRSDIELDRK